MNLLILDTAYKKGVAILYREGLGFEKKEFDARDQQKFLIDSIDSLFQETNTSLTDLTHIATCIGPGSFTGTRIGVMTAKTLSYTMNLPLIPFNSLIPYHSEGTLTLLDAKNGHCFCFDGTLLQKTTYDALSNEKRQFFAPDPETIPLPTKQASYSIENILSLYPEQEFSLIY